MTLPEIARRLGLRADADLDIDDFGDDPPTPAGRPTTAASAAPTNPDPPPADPEVRRLREDLAREREERLAERRAGLLAGFRADAETFTAAEVAAGRLTKAQADRTRPLLAQLAADDHDHPVEGFNRVEALRFVVAEYKPHGMHKEVVPGAKTELRELPNGGDAEDPAARAAALNRKYLGAPKAG